MEKPGVQEFRSPAPPNWRKLCEELVEASGNAGRMDGLASWESLLDRTRTLLAQSDPDPYKEDTDCDGTGVIVVSAPSPTKGLSDNDLIAAANEAGLCYPQCWDFSSQPERLEHLRSFAHSIIARCGNHFPDATKKVSPAPAPAREVVTELVAAVNAAYSAWGWVDEKQFARLFGEVSRLASIIEEGCDCSVDGPLNWKAEIEHFRRASTPPAGELVAWLREEAHYQGSWPDQRPSAAVRLTRAADLLEQSRTVLVPVEGEVAILARWMRDCAESAQRNGYHDAENMHIRIAELLENQFASSPVQVKGKVANAVADLHSIAEILSAKEDHLQARKLTRAADLLEILILKPIPLSERLPGPEDCDAEGRCWWFCLECPGEYSYWILAKEVYCDPTCWLPFHALPLPTSEAQP